MKRLRADELPDSLSEELIRQLAEIAIEFPKKDFLWAEVSKILEERGQLQIVLDMVDKIARENEAMRKSCMSEEEKEIERLKWRKIHLDKDLDKFYGNMGEPQTAEEYKRKYGAYPPDYNKNKEK